MRKGCDERRRQKFHQQFRNRLADQELKCENVFDRIDVGRIDRFIDNDEYQYFIKQWNRNQRQPINNRLSKCFRTEIHYCDQDDDGRLNRHEWSQCCLDKINHNHNQFTLSSASALSTSSRIFPNANIFHGLTFSSSIAEAYHRKKYRPRTGPNPLKILKSE